MFHDIPDAIRQRMRRLEKADARDRGDGTAGLQRLSQIPPEAGRLLAILAASAPAGGWVEIGTSAGYSALWLALAARQAEARLTTFEVMDSKSVLARVTIEDAGVGDVVELVHGDAREHLERFADIGFCFLDADPEVYADCYEAVVPRLAPGGLLVADSCDTAELRPLVKRALTDDRVDATLVTLSRGALLCRRPVPR